MRAHDGPGMARHAPAGNAAFVDAFERHHAEVHRFVAARAGAVRADDLAAEVFLTAYRRRRDFDPARGGMRPWLLGIAVNVLRNEARGARRRLAVLGRVRTEPVVDGTEDIDGRLDARGAAARLNTALARLRPGDRDVFRLGAWTELTYEEIAMALRLPVGTVRSRMHRARTMLRDALTGPEDPG